MIAAEAIPRAHYEMISTFVGQIHKNLVSSNGDSLHKWILTSDEFIDIIIDEESVYLSREEVEKKIDKKQVHLMYEKWRAKFKSEIKKDLIEADLNWGKVEVGSIGVIKSERWYHTSIVLEEKLPDGQIFLSMLELDILVKGSRCVLVDDIGGLKRIAPNDYSRKRLMNKK